MTAKHILVAAACFGATAVMLGAFGAHALKALLSERALGAFEVAVKYQMWHASVLLFLGLMTRSFPQPLFLWSAGFFIFGILLFSGSLYLLTFGAPNWLGPVTPLGGLSLIIGWMLLAVAALRLETAE